MKKKKVFSLSFGTMFLSCFEEERKRIDGVYKVYLLVCQLPSAISEQIFRQIQHEFLPKIKPAKSIVHLCTDHFKPYNKTTYLCKRKRLLSKIFMQISCCWPTNFWIGEIFFFCCLFNTCNTTAITKHNNNRVQLSKVTPRWLKKKKRTIYLNTDTNNSNQKCWKKKASFLQLLTSFRRAEMVRICSSYESSRWSAFSSDTSSDFKLLPTTRSSSSSSTILLHKHND